MSEEFETQRVFVPFNDPDTDDIRVMEQEVAFPKTINVYTQEELYENRKEALELLRTTEMPEVFKQEFEWMSDEGAMVGDDDLKELKNKMKEYDE